jgi:hypothetical protein
MDNHSFEFDFDKINTIEDIKRVLVSLGIRLNQDGVDKNNLKDIIKDGNRIS